METWVVLTDDWELRGNGTGTVAELQRTPALRLMDLYERHGFRSTFMVEVMQQLAFERYAAANGSIRKGRDDWRQTVEDMVARGFDVQLHLHPQWHDASLIDGWWKLDRRLNIVDYPDEIIKNIVGSAVDYLRPLVAPGSISSFRAGAWGLGPPSRAALTSLSDYGIRLDVSAVKGIVYNGEGIQLDYRRLSSGLLPYRPDLDDFRKLSTNFSESIDLIELPTQSVSRLPLILRLIPKLNGKHNSEVKRDIRLLLENYVQSRWLIRYVKALIRNNRRGPPAPEDNYPDFVLRDLLGFAAEKSDTEVIFDISSRYSPITFHTMFDFCIRRKKSAEKRRIPVLVLANHTKDLRTDADFDRIESIITYIKRTYPEVKFKTLHDVAQEHSREGGLL